MDRGIALCPPMAGAVIMSVACNSYTCASASVTKQCSLILYICQAFCVMKCFSKTNEFISGTVKFCGPCLVYGVFQL